MNLSVGKPKNFEGVVKAALTAFKKLHETGSYNPKDLLEVEEYADLVNATSNIFSSAITHDVPEDMKEYLEKDVFMFSGLKTHAQLTEARSLLKDGSGNIRPYEDFERSILKLNEQYNTHYLEAEYEFAVQSSQSAAQWVNLQDDTSRYWLEYRTAGDEKVRASHAALNGICLPADDSFWLEYYPPNGWRCRCVAVEILARDGKLSDSNKAKKLGEAATSQISPEGKNKLAMFRFNPGAEKKIFPSGNAYEKFVGAEIAKKQLAKQNSYTLPSELKHLFDSKNIKIDEDFIKLIDKDLKFQFSDKYTRVFGTSYYRAKEHKIVLDIRNNHENYEIKNVFYHEFGHSIDEKRGYYKNPKTTALVNKYLKDEKYGFSYFKELDEKVKAIPSSSRTIMEQKGSLRDTIMAMTLNYGAGHTKKYFTAKGEFNRQREFLAHCFENRYCGNEIFEKLAPELFNDMKNLIDELNSDK